MDTKLADSAITDRPWRGKCATTGLTMDDFRERLSFTSPQHGDMPDWVTRAAVSICRSYGIKGLSDPMFIANVINNARQDYRQRPICYTLTEGGTACERHRA